MPPHARARPLFLASLGQPPAMRDRAQAQPYPYPYPYLYPYPYPYP